MALGHSDHVRNVRNSPNNSYDDQPTICTIPKLENHVSTCHNRVRNHIRSSANKSYVDKPIICTIWSQTRDVSVIIMLEITFTSSPNNSYIGKPTICTISTETRDVTVIITLEITFRNSPNKSHIDKPTICAISKLMDVKTMFSRCEASNLTINPAHAFFLNKITLNVVENLASSDQNVSYHGATTLAKTLGTLLQKHRKFAHSPSTPYAMLI